ncbi:MAG: hypothetical protein ABJA02_11375 [Acidobacteriota bacterium]
MKAIFLISLVLLGYSTFAAQTPRKIEQLVLEHINKLSQAGGHHGMELDGMVEAENRAIKKLLATAGKRRDVLDYQFPQLQDSMTIATSYDGKFRAYSWDAESGGSAAWNETIFQYLGRDGRVRVSIPKYREGEVCPPFYSQIFQLGTAAGRLYVANSTSVCSNSLSVQKISLFRIAGSILDDKVRLIRTESGLQNSISFEYDFFSVVDHPERPIKLVFYDSKNKSFRFPVVIEDDKTPQGRVTDKFITYRFNGKYFVKVS